MEKTTKQKNKNKKSLRNSAISPHLCGEEDGGEKKPRSDFVITYPGGELDLSERTAVMGVVNVTPDSFSDGGDYYRLEAAIEHALKEADEGADIIDIGGESSRPGSDPVSADEEMQRVIPVIESVSLQVQVPISIDTCKPEVAHAAIDAGAKMVNDISGLRQGDAMARLAAERKVPIILMHMKGEPKTMQKNPVYNDLILEIYSQLRESIEAAISNGIDPCKIIIDPGIGFGKTFEHNLIILNRLAEFTHLGHPVCIGVSRKAFLGAILDEMEPKERLAGTIAASICAVRAGAKIIRVHDVSQAVQAVKVADAISAGRMRQEA